MKKIFIILVMLSASSQFLPLTAQNIAPFQLFKNQMIRLGKGESFKEFQTLWNWGVKKYRGESTPQENESAKNAALSLAIDLATVAAIVKAIMVLYTSIGPKSQNDVSPHHIPLKTLLLGSPTYADSVKSVKKKIERGVPQKEINDELFEAVKNGDTELIKWLLEKNAQINATDQNGDTPLIVAINEGKKKAVELLLKNNALIDQKNNLGNTALMQAVQKENYENVEKLLKKGAGVNLQNNKGDTALTIAAFYNSNPSITHLLLKHGADKSLKNNASNTALLIASYIGNSYTQNLIGSDPTQTINTQNNDGMTPLMMAVSRGKKNIVVDLLNRGAGINLQNNNGDTALIIAARHDAKGDVVNLLLDYNAKVTPKNNEGETALVVAAKGQGSHINAVKYILDKEKYHPKELEMAYRVSDEATRKLLAPYLVEFLRKWSPSDKLYLPSDIINLIKEYLTEPVTTIDVNEEIRKFLRAIEKT